MLKIKAALFDLDGTLVDIGPDMHFRALNAALDIRGHAPIDIEEHTQKYNGLPTITKLEKLGFDEEEIASINLLKQKITLDLIDNELIPNPVAIKAIHDLKNSGIKIACVTNCSKQTTMLMLRRAGLESLMDLVITNEDVSCPKPDPEGYLKAMVLLGVIPDETIIFEDSSKGIQAAAKSGCSFYIVNDQAELVRLVNSLQEMVTK